MSKIIVFDIDGTLANIDHRRQFVASKPKNWKAFTAVMDKDPPNDDIVFLAKLFYQQGYIVLICTGRNEGNKSVTVEWLAKQGVEYKKIYMRNGDDFRRDSIVKVELLAQIRQEFGEPYLWFDDRNQVVDAIRAEGVRVLQVAPGDF